MSKKSLIWTLGAIIVLAASVNVGMNLFGNNAERELFLANVEALTEEESSSGLCPDYNYAPNGVITTEPYQTAVVSDANGNISISNKIFGGFEKNKSYYVLYQVKNCDEWVGACCDQREVGVTLVTVN